MLILLVLTLNLLPLNLVKPAQASSNLEINIYLPESINNASALTTFGNSLNVKFSSAKWYLDWTDDFTPGIARGLNGQGTIPELVWQPEIGSDGVSYSDVTSGKYDNYLNNFATSVKNLGFPVRINLAPEMNSNWEPWGIGNDDNTADGFKSFWQYTVNKFRSDGANNVSWIWAPNIHYWGEPCSYASMYPGDNYVDFAGLEGYNWGTTQSWSSWQSFSDIFRFSYNDITSVSSRNVIITEFASAEKGGDKAQWILDMFHDARNNFSRLQGITWFNINKETDWRINSSDASIAAFKNGARGDYSTAVNNQTQENNQSNSNNNSSQSTASKNTATIQNTNQANNPTDTQVNIDNQIPTQYVLPFAKIAFYNDKTQKAVLAAKTIKSTWELYFTKDNILLLIIIIEFILFSFFTIVTLLVGGFSKHHKKH